MHAPDSSAKAVRPLWQWLTLVIVGCFVVYGANFRELGDAWGISRQGARKRWSSLRAGPDAGDRVRLTYGDGSGCEGTWEDTPDGPALRLDDGTLHAHVTGQVCREVIERGAGDA